MGNLCCQYVTTPSLLSFLVLAACEQSPIEASAEASADTEIAKPYVSVNATSTKKGTLKIGDESYSFDSVTCVGTSMATAVAADRANRDGYPTVTLKTFDLSMTGGVNSNTASVQFRSSTRDELWLLHEGDVEKLGDIFEASGTLKGKRMQTQPDGKLKSQPLDGDDLKPFQVRIEC